MSQQKSIAVANLKHDFEAWAAVSARLLKRNEEERSAIIDNLELSDVWAEADEHWSQQISAGVSADDMRLANRYGEICAVEILARRAAGGTQTARPTPPTPPPQPPPAESPSARQQLVGPQAAGPPAPIGAALPVTSPQLATTEPQPAQQPQPVAALPTGNPQSPADHPAVQHAALYAHPPASGTAAQPAAALAQSPPCHPAVQPSIANSDVTVGFSGPMHGAAMPFSGQRSPQPAATPANPLPPSSSGTVALSGTRMAANHEAANPFGHGQASFPQLTVQQYAKFSAEFAEQPERLAEIYESFDIEDQSAHHLLHEHWKGQLAQDGTTSELFDMLYQRFRLQLRNKK